MRVLLLGGTSEIGLAILSALRLGPDAEVILAGRDTQRLEAAGKRVTNIHYPTLVAETLGISLVQNTAFYRGYPALLDDAAPHAIVIEHESPVRW